MAQVAVDSPEDTPPSASSDQRKPHSSSRFEPGPPLLLGRGRNAAHKLPKKAGDMTRFWLGRSVAWRLPSLHGYIKSRVDITRRTVQTPVTCGACSS